MIDKNIPIPLTAGELAQLWAQYLNDSASNCILTCFLEKAEDKEIQPVIEYAIEISKLHTQKITALLTDEKSKVPHGFCTKKDVDINAPRLYSDSFVINFINQMFKVGLTLYGAAVSSSARNDIKAYFINFLEETIELNKRSTDLLLSKGLFIRAPSIPYIEEVEISAYQSPTFVEFIDRLRGVTGTFINTADTCKRPHKTILCGLSFI